MPSKVVGIGSNYRKHILEMGRTLPTVPKVFLKPNTSVIGPNAPILAPPNAQRVDHEAELGVVIGRRASRVSKTDAMQYVLGVTCINDVTCRDFQRADGVFARGKGFDSFCPMGPWILKTQDNVARDVRCTVDGEEKQSGNTSDLIFDVPTLIAFVSNIMTLLPGDVIATGTPSGVSPLSEGQRVTVHVEGVGALTNPVVNRQDRIEMLEELIDAATWGALPLFFIGLFIWSRKWRLVWLLACCVSLIYLLQSKSLFRLNEFPKLANWTGLESSVLLLFSWSCFGGDGRFGAMATDRANLVVLLSNGFNFRSDRGGDCAKRFGCR